MPKKFADQFKPFEVFGFNPNRQFPGTLIRLPLKVGRRDESENARQDPFADWNDGSDNEEDAVDMGTLGDECASKESAGKRENKSNDNSFDRRMEVEDLEDVLACCSKMIGPESLLFLEHVESVEVSSWREEDLDMKLLFKTCLQSPVSPATRQSRTAMTLNKEWQKFNLMSVFGSAPAIRHQYQLGITTYYPVQDVKQSDKWLIHSTLGTKSARKMALENKHRGWVPLASVAAHLSGKEGVAPDLDGHVFAFGKVSRTGLPLHVNAWFEVTDSLVGWGGERHRGGQRAGGAEDQAKLEWNRELFACVVDAYLDLLTAAPQVFSSDPSLVYRLWPRQADVEGVFYNAIHRPLYLDLAKMQIFLLPNGQMAKMNGGVFRPDATSESLNLLFRQIFPMFMCPPALADEFRAAGVHDVSEVSADRVRQRLRKDAKVIEGVYTLFTRSSETQGEARAKMNSFIIDTLEFCLSDLSALAPPGAPKSLRELHGLRLLPVTGGQLLALPNDAVVALRHEQILMPGLSDNMVDAECVERLSRFLLNPDFLAGMGLKRFSPSVLAANLHLLLPRHWRGAPLVHGYMGNAQGLPSPSWLRSFWKFVGADNMHLFNQWPVIPLTTGELVSAASLPKVLTLAPTLPFLPDFDGEGAANEPVTLYDFGECESEPTDSQSAAGDDAGRMQQKQEEDAEDVAMCQRLRAHPLFTGLRRLGCPIVHPLFTRHLPRPDAYSTARNALVALAALAGREGVETQPLREKECKSLFKFFAKSHASPAQSFDGPALAALKKLPIFETRAGSFVSLHEQGEQRECFICPPNLNVDAPSEQLLLHQEPALYAALGVTELDDTALFERFVLPRYASLTPPQQAQACAQLKRNWTRIKERAALVDNLKTTPLVNMLGNMMRADQMLDPHNALLASVFKDDPVFPTGQFATDEWLGILRYLGLQTTIDADLFLLCARRVRRTFSQGKSTANSSMAAEALENASSLVKHLTSNFAQLSSSTFCSALADLAFVPADLPLSVSAENSATEQGGVELMRFCDTAMPADKYLVWSVMPVLHGIGGSSGRLAPNEIMRMQLKMHSPPPLSLVLEHLANMRPDTLYRWPLPDFTVEACYQKTYDFLWSRWGDMKEGERRTLRGLACVPVGDALVKPSRIFCRLAGDLSPFMFELPRHLGAHEPLLKALGAKESPTGADLVTFLHELGAECNGQPLNPNELAAALSLENFSVIKVLEALTELDTRRCLGFQSLSIRLDHVWEILTRYTPQF